MSGLASPSAASESASSSTERPTEVGWAFTWFPKRYQPRQGRRVFFNRSDLRRSMQEACRTRFPKKEQELICPATFRHNHRLNANVEAVSMLVLDLDEGQSDPRGCVRRIATALGDVEVFAHSTFSSVSGAYRMRTLIPYARAATPEEHWLSCALVYRILRSANIFVDEKCSDPARGFYMWRVPPSGAYLHIYEEGNTWPVAEAASAERRRRADERKRALLAARRLEAGASPARSEWRRGSSTLSVVERARRYVAKMPPAISGAGGHNATFAVARRLVVDFELPHADAWALLLEYNERCQPPWSERELRHKLDSAAQARVRVPLVSR